MCGSWLSLAVAGPFPPSPSRACQGLPWHGATLIAQRRAGSPIHGLGVEAAPYRGGATHMRVGADRGKGGRKKWKGARKKTCFSGGRACSLQATRPSAGPTPSHRRPPYPRRAYYSWGSSLVLGVYTWPRGDARCPGGLDECRWSCAHVCGLERPDSRESYRIHKTWKKGPHSPRPPFIANPHVFVNVFLKGKLKVVYEVPRREDYFKFRFTGKRLILKRDISGSFPTGRFQKFLMCDFEC